ncbi:TauD/TfdA family dioxygenase [Kutzneria sp. NPDC052558]|uniref:TauD/TfdA family dioxygenase n=1 Tax=Kutzneria sp. NPDC052558 TaxID=3364121 RepID=UPI0037C9B1EB
MRVDKVVSGGTTLVLFDGEPSGDDVEEVLDTTGIALVRGLGIDTPDRFHAAVGDHGEPLDSYRGGNTPRTKVSDGIFTSTEYPPEYEISLHNELSYARTWPSRLFFCCLVAPADGGETPVCDGRALLNGLDAEVRDRFTEHGVLYRQHLHGGYGLGKSWQQTFETDDKSEVERFLADADMRWEWTEDGLRTAAVRPATLTRPGHGEVWFNQADQWHPSTLPPDEHAALLELVDSEEDLPQSAAYGDGTPISPADLDHVRQVARSHEVAVPWQPGDLLIVDNVLALHGRRPFRGPRRILVAMT